MRARRGSSGDDGRAVGLAVDMGEATPLGWLGGRSTRDVRPPAIIGAMSRIPVILDVDTGVDDSLAILCACASPEVELVAVTCVAGNVPARQVAKNSLAVVEPAGRSDVPVILGAEQPLIRQLVRAEDTTGPEGLGHGTLPAAKRGLESGHAADHIVELVRARPGEILLVTLGPLTNLALALDRERTLPTFLGGYALMGGAYRVPGNTTPTTGWYIHGDPDPANARHVAWPATPHSAIDRP